MRSDLDLTLAFASGIAIAAAAAYLATGRGSWRWKEELPSSSTASGSLTACATDLPGLSSALDDDILGEQFTRNLQFFGDADQKRIFDASVAVIGLGGVGSHAASILLRSGVGHLRLIDFDQVSLSSLNRHAVATRADVGTSKAQCLKAHFAQIVPEAKVEAKVAMFTADSAEELLEGSLDYVLDAIDNIDTKIALLAACKQRGIRVICVAGAGAKADPSRVRIADISDCAVDPLARTVRRGLRRHHGIADGIPVVLSTERPRCELLPVEELGDNPLDYQVIPNFRVRTIPVLGTMPAAFGLAAAAHILCHLARQPFTPEPIFRIADKQYKALWERLVQREELVFGNTAGPEVDLEDVKYIVRDLWRGLSARGPKFVPVGTDRAMNRPTNHLTLTRWNTSKPADVHNLVLLTFDEAEAHEGTSLEQVRMDQPDFYNFVLQRLQQAT